MTPRPASLARLAAALLLCFLLTACRLMPQKPAPAVTPQQAAAPPDPDAFRPDDYSPISVRAQAARIPVIMYHDIIARRGRGSVWFDCTKAEFEEQMDYLQQEGAQPISLEQLHRHLVRGEAVPDKAIVLTFDDNYQGFFDNAYPILKSHRFPSAMFVHTNYVGDKKSDHPKMSWETLKQLDQEGLVTIASHTMSHPDDMRKLSAYEQEQELSGAKQALEKRLGHTVPYLAYPDGCQDATTREVSRKVGYTMAFTIENGPVEESPDILALNRYIHTRLKKAWTDCLAAKGAAAFWQQELAADSPIRLEVKEYAGVPLGLVRGGIPVSRRAIARQSVGDFVKEANGVAGINGTFFADARLIGTGCTLIGPSQTSGDGLFAPEEDAYRLTRIGNRPIVIWGPKQIAIFPFTPGSMNSPEIFKSFMPDYTDLFMAGAWIVHNGKARTEEELKPCAAGDFQDTRRRAFFGISAKGEVILGATLAVVSTTTMAEAAAAAGAQEAVLLDSGFSTSLIYDQKVIVTGHTAKNLPSRPVPHAIVLMGTLEPPKDAETASVLQGADPAVVALRPGDAPGDSAGATVAPDGGLVQQPLPRRRRRRRRAAHHAPAATAPEKPASMESGLSTAPSSPPPADAPKSDSPDKL